MSLLKSSNDDLINGIIAEIAKANNELKCSQADVKKASSRLAYLNVLVKELLSRNLDK